MKMSFSSATGSLTRKKKSDLVLTVAKEPDTLDYSIDSSRGRHNFLISHITSIFIDFSKINASQHQPAISFWLSTHVSETDLTISERGARNLSDLIRSEFSKVMQGKGIDFNYPFEDKRNDWWAGCSIEMRDAHQLSDALTAIGYKAEFVKPILDALQKETPKRVRAVMRQQGRQPAVKDAPRVA